MIKNYISFPRVFLLLFLILINAGALQAQKTSIKNIPRDLGSIKASKVDPELLKLQKNFDASSKQRKVGDLQPFNKYIQVIDGYVVVDITATEDAYKLAADLSSIGMKDISVYGRTISGLLPLKAIENLSSLSTLKVAKPAYKPKTNAGAVTSQGDAAQRSDVAREVYKVSGKGVSVGVLSDSYNVLKGADSTIRAGELPGPGNPDGFTEPVNVLKDWPAGTDEGRAMIEIVHDVAPAAKLAFHSANGGQAAFANGILSLAQQGSNVIVDDIIYYFEPFFQDGIIAQVVDQVSKKGVLYFSSAGNQDRASYQSSFKPSKVEPLGAGNGVAHDFGNGDISQEITIPKGGSLLLILQWDDPFFSVSGKGAKTDLDIFLLNAAGDSILSGSGGNNIDDDPVEAFYFENTGETKKFNILITKFAGPDPKILKYIDFEGYATFDEYHTKSSTSYGHSNAKEAVAVGAARYNRTPEFGINPPRVEGFSSAGGTVILFNPQGDRIFPQDRRKPEITAPNGGNTSFFSPGFDYEPDGWPNFFGTSASAPHAAAVAALMLEATKKNLDRKKLLWAFDQSAIDMDDPLTKWFDLGFDYVSGAGLVQADLAVGAALRGKQHVEALRLIAMCSQDPLTERRWKVRNPNDFTVNVIAQVYGTDQAQYVRAEPGDTYFNTKTSNGLNTVIAWWKNEWNFYLPAINASWGNKCTSSPLARLDYEGETNGEEVTAINTFPNPVVNKLTIQLKNRQLDNVNVTIHNPLGEKIYDRKFDAIKAEDEVDFSGLPRGLYLLHVNHDLYGGTYKILKE